jgi:hypothetical protein
VYPSVNPSDSPSHHSLHLSIHQPLNKSVTPITNSTIKPITNPFGDEKELLGWTEVQITHAGRTKLLETNEDQTDLLASIANRTEAGRRELQENQEVGLKY